MPAKFLLKQLSEESETDVNPYQKRGLCLITGLITMGFAFTLHFADREEAGKER